MNLVSHFLTDIIPIKELKHFLKPLEIERWNFVIVNEQRTNNQGTITNEQWVVSKIKVTVDKTVICVAFI